MKLTHRELIQFIRHLPPQCATARAMHGPVADWTPDTYLAASIANATAAIAWAQGGGKGSKPTPIKPPKARRRRT
ncbi:hypothetical protein amrb99_97650 [Actinomadura sp. RB99]|uniref:hypothetical protein n=1 Tax=Actinomadura sp. RB99 TaxID=2691577 RepID=UPI001686C0B0|nr:hypothetical protein [Actinomadura sp. RB99]MBD2900756.1 hypothetical protein [Actinomadura sp. RB99]